MQPSAHGSPARNGGSRGPIRLLVIARNYPNPEMPLLGLWTQRLVHSVTPFAEAKVIAPVPYAPPLPTAPRFDYYRRFRSVPRVRWEGPVEVNHPRILIGPGSSTDTAEALAYTVAAGRAAARVRRRFAFELIHAHFTYPDGVAACLIGRRYGVPVVITEHVPWVPWMPSAPLVRRQASWAARSCAAHIPVSSYVARTIDAVIGGDRVAHDPMPVLVDAATFTPANVARKPGALLFVGAVRHTKGLDVLLDSLALLARSHPEVRLVVAGEAYYRQYRRDFDAARARAEALGIAGRVQYVGAKTPREVARLMSESAVVVMPSRAESFGSVLIESLACGTPVVATRSGGPEDIVTDEVGVLVPSEDPAALAQALAGVLENPRRYDPIALRRHALERYGRDVIAARILARYETVLARA